MFAIILALVCVAISVWFHRCCCKKAYGSYARKSDDEADMNVDAVLVMVAASSVEKEAADTWEGADAIDSFRSNTDD